MVKKYGQTVLVTQDLALENYLDKLSASHCHGYFPDWDHDQDSRTGAK
jgi:hypothetical protein